MRVTFRKLTDERHVLAIVRSDGRREEVECETRSYLLHDLLHYAVEAEARLDGGFWGHLARGKTLAQMNDRARGAGADEVTDESPGGVQEMAAIEQLVGALHGATKGRSAAEMVTGMQRFAGALGATLPAWLTEAFVLAVQERLRRLTGQWRATPFGGAMDLRWPPAPP